MVPIIISTTPNKGSTSVPVDSTIVIEFAQALITDYVSVDTFTLMNLNTQSDVSCNITLNNTVGEDDGDTVTITPNDDAAWNNVGLNGLTEYRLTINGVYSASGDLMQGSYFLDFKTVADDQDVVPDPQSDDYVEESHELYGRGPELYSAPRKTWDELVQDNQAYLNYLLDQENSTITIDWNLSTAPSGYESEYYAAKKYVETKTTYDLTYSKYIKMATSASKKTLADLSISYRSDLQDLRDLLDDLYKEYKHWEQELLEGDGPASPRIFVKGSSVDPVYDFHDRRVLNRAGEEV